MGKSRAASANRAPRQTQVRSVKEKVPGHATRETIESIAIAVILAFLFRAFVAEAFVIPTGSMAPTLMGQHKDVQCPECGFWYQAGASIEIENQANDQRMFESGRLASRRMVVGTTARTGKHRQPHWRLDELACEIVATAAQAELAVVFGREDRGLTDRELDRCTHLVHLPASRAYPSFNLAQAVLLVAYELRRATLRPSGADNGLPADQAAREAMYGHLERALSVHPNFEGAEDATRQLEAARAAMSESKAPDS